MCSAWPKHTLARVAGRWQRCCPKTPKRRASHEPRVEKIRVPVRVAGGAPSGSFRFRANVEAAASRKSGFEERAHGVAARKARRADDQPVRHRENRRLADPAGEEGLASVTAGLLRKG